MNIFLARSLFNDRDKKTGVPHIICGGLRQFIRGIGVTWLRSLLVSIMCIEGSGQLIGAPPQNVTVTAPINGTNLQVSSPAPTVNITASATPSASGSIASVEFRVNGNSIGSTTTPPYSVAWSPTSAGTFSITAT